MGWYGSVLAQGLALSNRAMQYASNDLANSQTPNFRSKTLSFQGELARALRHSAASAAHVQGVVQTEPGSLSPNGSSVDMTAVMVNLTHNETLYNLAAQALTIQETSLQTVVNTSTP